MIRFVFFLITLSMLLGRVENSRIKRQAHRSLSYPKTLTQSTPDGVQIRSESYVRSPTTNTRRHPSWSQDRGLSLYEDFVNDPWKPTQDLHSILSERGGQKELRSGHQDPRDDLWGDRSRHWTTTTTTSTQRPSPGQWDVSNHSGDHITYVRRWAPYDSHVPEGLRGWDYYPHGSGDGEWIVESKGDSYITYRRRGSRRPWPRYSETTRTSSTAQRLGHGSGEVAARIVNPHDTDYTSARLQHGSSSHFRPGLQVRSGDSIQHRHRDATESVYPRYRDSNGGRVTISSYPQQGGNWRAVSRDGSHVTWTKVSDDYVTSDEHHRYQSPVSSNGSPHYPMLHERETAERANRVGATNTLAVVY